MSICLCMCVSFLRLRPPCGAVGVIQQSAPHRRVAKHTKMGALVKTLLQRRPWLALLSPLPVCVCVCVCVWTGDLYLWATIELTHTRRHHERISTHTQRQHRAEANPVGHRIMRGE